MTLYRHRAIGTSGTAESWSFTMHSTGNLSVGDANVVWRDSLAAFWTGAANAEFAPAITLATASTTTIDEATDGQISRDDLVVGVPGTATAESLPYQCAVVISLLTTLANRHGYGRIYLPAPAVSAMSGGVLSSGFTAAVAADMQDFFTAMSNGALTVVLRDRVHHVSTTVVSARIGNVVDTQRRRRDKLAETYTPIAV